MRILIGVTSITPSRRKPHVVPTKVCCPQCGSRDVIRRGQTARWLRNLPVGEDCTWLIATLPRVECRSCRIVRQIRLGLAEERRTYTRAFARYVLELCRYMTIKDVAVHLGVSWDIVKDIQKHHLARELNRLESLSLQESC